MNHKAFFVHLLCVHVCKTGYMPKIPIVEVCKMTKEVKNLTIKPVALAVSAAFISSLAVASVANAADNPFNAEDLDAGYMLAGGDKGEEGKCGEGKCGGDKEDGEGSCGEDKEDGEGSCGEDKEDGEGSCGEDKEDGEGSCGEDKGEEKGEEGKCGEGKCGGNA
jgi:uncharacterized low-complexity protein